MHEHGFAELQGIIGEEFNVPAASIKRSTNAEDVDGWDSISHASLVIRIEIHFGITFANDTIYDLADVGALHDALTQLLVDKAARKSPACGQNGPTVPASQQRS